MAFFTSIQAVQGRSFKLPIAGAELQV